MHEIGSAASQYRGIDCNHPAYSVQPTGGMGVRTGGQGKAEERPRVALWSMPVQSSMLLNQKRGRASSYGNHNRNEIWVLLCLMQSSIQPRRVSVRRAPEFSSSGSTVRGSQQSASRGLGTSECSSIFTLWIRLKTLKLKIARKLN